MIPSDVRLHEETRDQIRHNYLNASNTRQRTESVFVDTLLVVESKIEVFNDAINFIGSRILDKYSSVPVIVEDIISNLREETINDICSSLFDDHDIFVDQYRTEVLRRRKVFHEALQMAITYMTDYISLIDSIDTNYPLDVEWGQMIQHEMPRVLLHTFQSIRAYRNLANYAYNYLEFVPSRDNIEQRTDDECDRMMSEALYGERDLAFELTNRSKQELNFDLLDDDSLQNVNYASLNAVPQLKNYMKTFIRDANFTIVCQQEYYQFLQDTSEWLKQLKLSTQSHARSLLKEEEINVLKSDIARIKQFPSHLMDNKLSLTDFAERFGELQIGALRMHMAEFQTRASQSVLQPVLLYLQVIFTYIL